ncbi:MAG: type IV secretion system DNA-binding domain-containing protein [Acidobacteria bacterium]|nr:type IV secretion system DNA-binding domain-containing protein [Acidobacteriota bacterium]
MGIEEMLVRVLNRRRRNASESSGLCLGEAENMIGGQRERMCLPVRPIQHAFVCGRTGSGKTTLLLRLIAEHVRVGAPFLFIDFHGPATELLLAMIGDCAESRQFVLLEPWSDPVVSWNPLETNGESPYATVQELIAIFRHRLWPDAWGPRLEELLRMTLLALAEAQLTLLEASNFLSRPEFRRAVLTRVTIPEVREFWALRFERLSPSQRSLVSETVLNKLSVFHDPALKYIIGQQCSSLDLDRALGAGQSVIANLSAGRLRGHNFLLAALLVAKLKAAVYRRVPEAKPYAIFLDEFQEMFALDALDDYLRSFRKFGCSVYLATQHLQLPPEMKAAIFGNCARFFCFATSATDAVFLGREFGPPEGDLVTALLPELGTGQALVKFRGKPTQLLQVLPPSVKTTDERVAAGRRKCLQLGRRREDIDHEIRRRFAGFLPEGGRKPRQASPSPKGQATASDLPEGYGSS